MNINLKNFSYNELFVISDTCQSASMYQNIYSPRVLATSSSLVGEDSLSHHIDRSIGVYIVDRYAYFIQQFLDSRVKNLASNTSMMEYIKACSKDKCISTVGVRTDLYSKKLSQVRVTDFFGAKRYTKNVKNALFNKEELDIIFRTETIELENYDKKWVI